MKRMCETISSMREINYLYCGAFFFWEVIDFMMIICVWENEEMFRNLLLPLPFTGSRVPPGSAIMLISVEMESKKYVPVQTSLESD